MPLQKNGDRSGGLGTHIRKALERRRLATPPSQVPLIRRTVMMGKPRRDIFVELCRRPCMSASQVARSLGTSRANVLWHIHKLLNAGLLLRVKRARSSVYLPKNLITDAEIPLFHTLSDPTVRRAFARICERPGITHGELAKIVGVSRQNLHWLVLKLVRVNVVEVLEDCRYRRYDPTPLFNAMAKAHSRRTGTFRGALMKALRDDNTQPSIVRVLPSTVLLKLRTGPRFSVLEVPVDPYEWALRAR